MRDVVDDVNENPVGHRSRLARPPGVYESFATWLSIGILCGSLAGCQPAPHDPAPQARSATTRSEGASSAFSTPGSSRPPDPPGTYLGRTIAPTMSHEAADWLTRPERQAEENATRMLQELGLRPGDVACDLGAGNGYHTLEMAKAVAPGGRAIGIDIQPEMLALLRDRARAAHVSNVETILGTQSDPKLPPHGCDLVLLADVYHELDDPAGMLASIRSGLSDRGLVVLLEFRGEDPNVPIKPEHKMSKKQIVLELETNGYTLSRSFDGLPWQHLMFFAAKR